MIDIEARLRKTFSALAGNESLSETLDETAAADMLKWGQALVEPFVRKTSEMEEAAADEFLSPYLRACRMLMRAASRWYDEQDQTLRREWWTRMDQAGKMLYGVGFALPPMDQTLRQLPANATGVQWVVFIKGLVAGQQPGG